MSKFKNSTGQLYTKGIFYETTLADKSTVLYTLKRDEHEGFPSLYRLYMDLTLSDPTEYTFATECLEGWDHWEILQGCAWFKDHLASWRREREVRDKAMALKAVMDLAQNPEAKTEVRFQANKFLLSWDNETKKRSRAGRPSKGEIKAEAERMALTEKTLKEDAERIRNFN